jgi:hypothetical protein
MLGGNVGGVKGLKKRGFQCVSMTWRGISGGPCTAAAGGAGAGAGSVSARRAAAASRAVRPAGHYEHTSSTAL